MAQPAVSPVIKGITMDSELNPFHDLYVTETSASRPEDFVELFSPFLIKNALLLFEPTNVVLKGTQGCGKSMLLNLLKPEIRLAYHKTPIDFPIPERLSTFIGAGINITRSGILDISQRPLSADPERDDRLFPLYFADFLNYWVVRDMLDSVTLMSKHPDVFPAINCESPLDEFARSVVQLECWFGYLDGARSLEELRARINTRIMAYRNYHQFNIRNLSEDISRTKTVIGEPISRAAECLAKCNIIKDATPIFIRIDQHEILCRSDDLRHDLGIQYRRIINKALSTRDPRVFYRIGTRSYAWGDDLAVFGTTSPLEWERDYKVIDLDDLLRRKEDRRAKWIFPGFAMDVFYRRLKRVYDTQGSTDVLFRRAMGRSPAPADLVLQYVGTSSARRALRIDDAWPREWQQYLESLFRDDPLEAKLAEAWALQKGEDNRPRMESPPPAEDRPWRSRRYWKKERVRQALMQLAASCGQRQLWWGEDNILSLSLGSILVFLSICQHIWDTLFRFERERPPAQRTNPLRGIGPEVQAIAIQTASSRWYHKIAVEEAGGNDRQRFINLLGQLLQAELYNDKALSYPGHNGFSLSSDDFLACPDVRRFLSDAVDYGDLYAVTHTTKARDRRQRIKWYLHPILSPHFKLPESHVKEPLYVRLATVIEWLKRAEITVKFPTKKSDKTSSVSDDLPLFPETDKR